MIFTGIQPQKIKPGVFFAPVAGEGVLLDLPANRYLGLTALSARLWTVLGRGGSRDDLVRAAACPDSFAGVPAEKVVERQLDQWEKAGLLIRSPDEGPTDLPVPRPELPRAVAAVLPADVAKAPLSSRQLVRQIWDSMKVKRSLRRAGLSATIRAIQRIPLCGSELTPSRQAMILRAYWMVRRPFAQGRPDCLSRSLGLYQTLRHAGFDASVCIGVRKCPFAAHAWVEAGGLLLNDSLDNVEQYFVIARF